MLTCTCVILLMVVVSMCIMNVGNSSAHGSEHVDQPEAKEAIPSTYAGIRLSGDFGR